MTFTATQKRDAIDRELKYRRYVYERRVAEGKMTQAKAGFEIAVMEAIRADYHIAAELEGQQDLPL